MIAKAPVSAAGMPDEAVTSTSVKAYPNPFINNTTISYTLKEAMQINLAVYDSKGTKMAQLVNGRISAGVHEARLDATRLAAGIYLYVLETVNAKGKLNRFNGKLMVQK